MKAIWFTLKKFTEVAGDVMFRLITLVQKLKQHLER